ncbi:MAG TPA: hypothetical protein VMV27_02145 [Candidatus Binataceae bacterium]|nr:hypothetical protein [Candidatus Binataceae bacterium]
MVKEKPELRLAKDLSLPADTAPAQRFAFIGRVGSGKTYAAGKFVELLYDSGRQVVVVDPVGNWGRGLRIAADGKDRGLDIPIFGRSIGANADFPLEPTGGKLIADVIVDHRASMVLDVSEMTYGEQCRFMADFAPHLLQRKKGAKSPLMLVVEEAQEFIPERTFRNTAVMVGAMTRLVKLGRNYGIGFALITQRPQAVSKEVLNLTEVLFVFQTSGPQERKAIAGWVTTKGLDLHAQLEELPGLDPGDGFLWSPQWLKTFRKVRVLPKRTFDASATPTEIELHADLKPIDLKQITAAMADTIERAKLDDPRELKRQLADLKRELAAKPKPVAAPDESAIARAVADGVARQHSEWVHHTNDALMLVGDLQKEMQKAVGALGLLESTLCHTPIPKAGISFGRLRTGSRAAATRGNDIKRSPSVSVAPALAGVNHRLKPVPQQSRNGNGAGGTLAKGERIVLTAIAQYPDGVERDDLTILTGYKRSTRDSYIQRLQAAGNVALDGSVIVATDEGVAALGDFEPLPSGDALYQWWLPRLPDGERKVLEFLHRISDWAPRDDISEGTDYKRSTRDSYIQRLRARRLVEINSAGGVRASEGLFD